MEKFQVNIGNQVTDEWLQSIGVDNQNSNGEEQAEEYDDGVKDLNCEAFAEAICKEDDQVARTAMFEISHYYTKGRFANDHLNQSLSELIKNLDIKSILEKALVSEEKKKVFLKVVKKLTRKGAKRAISKMMENIIVGEVVKASIGQGSRQAILVVEKSALTLFAKGTLKGLASFKISVAGSVGEIAAEMFATKVLGIKDQTALLAIRTGGGILACVAVGACIGGPPGAAGGLVAGALGATIGEGINILGRAIQTHEGTHCFVVRVDSMRSLAMGSYGGCDGIRAKTYLNQVLENPCSCIGAGQDMKSSFQLKFWASDSVFASSIRLFDEIYAGDYIFVSQCERDYVFVFCSGPNSPKQSKNERHYHRM